MLSLFSEKKNTRNDSKSMFTLYLKLGFGHIADLAGYDHILFILTLAGVYFVQHWKKILVLITAFTIGHSLTLALATVKIVIVDSDVVEFLIPLTILFTAVINLTKPLQENFNKQIHFYKYLLALFFGLIHGLGFSNYLRSLLGQEESMVSPLMAFNIGLEIGQILIVGIILVVSFLFTRLARVTERDWSLVVSGAGMGIALIMTIERMVNLL